MEVDKVRLIEEVRKRPLLWDFRHFYESRNNKKLAELWHEIAIILETEVSSCKYVWQNLRTAFFNETKRIPMREAKAKRKGTYDANKKYSTCPFFDSLKFIAYGRSVRGLHNPEVQVHYNTKFADSKDSVQKQSHQVNINANVSLPSENSKTSETIADSPPKYQSFDSYIQEIEFENPEFVAEIDNRFSYNKDIRLIDNDNAASTSKSEQGLGTIKSEPNIDQAEYQKQSESECQTASNNNSQLEQGEPLNTRILVIKKESSEYEFTDNKYNIGLVQENKPSTISDSKECVKNNESHSVVLEDNISKSENSNDFHYKFLCSLAPQMTRMSYLQKLRFRAKISSLILAIFATSAPVRDVDKRVLLVGDNDSDKKFLISFLPFLKSMSLSQNLQVQNKITDLVLDILSRNECCCSGTSA